MSRRPAPGRFTVTKEGIAYNFEAAEEGGYVVTVPLYPSCASQGETFEEALANIQDALVGCLSAARELKLPIPAELESILRQTAKL